MTNYSIINFSGGTAKVGGSQMGTIVNGTGYTCIDDYDGNFAALGTACV